MDRTPFVCPTEMQPAANLDISLQASVVRRAVKHRLYLWKHPFEQTCFGRGRRRGCDPKMAARQRRARCERSELTGIHAKRCILCGAVICACG